MKKPSKRFVIFLVIVAVVDLAIVMSSGMDILGVLWILGVLDLFLLFAYFGYFFGLRPMLDGMSSDNPDRRQHSFSMFGGGLFALGNANRRKEERNEKKKSGD